MNDGAVPVTVEWAQWGVASRDLGPQVLYCSNGALNAANFAETLTRYHPGVPEDLPQVTIGWLRDATQQNYYITFAIHEADERDPVDAAGRRTMRTRCFCVPYRDLAAGQVSYEAMYDEFGKMRIPDDNRSVIKTALFVTTAGAEPGPLAMRVAASLLTTKPVCVLGADSMSLLGRLRFLDSVMSLLPYGLRSQLSASTWASSLAEEHKIRLFFASARRRGVEEWGVTWDRDDRGPIGHAQADGYLNWLAREAQDQGSRLAGMAEPIKFGEAEIGETLRRLRALPGPEQARHTTTGRERTPAGESAATQGIGELLIGYANALRSGSPNRAESDLSQLSGQRYDLVTPDQRHWYQEIIKQHRLLRKDIRIKGSQRARSYEVLVRLAFELPLTYEGYCQLEDCVGGGPVHQPLLETVHSAGSTDFCVQLMLLKALHDETGLSALLGHQTPGVLIAAVADPKLRPEHGQLVYEIAIGNLLQRSGHLDEEALREDLRRQAFLAAALQRIHPGRVETQAAELRQLLRLAYRDGLDRSAIRQILGSIRSAPTIAALSALVALAANPEDAAWIDRAFTENLFAQTDTAGRPRRPWLDQVYDDGSDVAQDDGEQPPHGRPRLFRRS